MEASSRIDCIGNCSRLISPLSAILLMRQRAPSVGSTPRIRSIRPSVTLCVSNLLSTAILERLLRNRYVLNIRSESYRL